jgi:Tol biopolymer transport system component
MPSHTLTAATFGLSMMLVFAPAIPAQEPHRAESSETQAPKSNDASAAIAAAVSELALQLRRNPPQPSRATDRVAGLYMIEVSTGQVTLIADQPDAGVTYCGSSSWSNDGKRILFDAMRPEVVHRAHLKSIEVFEGKLKLTDLGVGNCPTFSPAGDRIAFLLNNGGVPGAAGGIWIMQADGLERVRLGSFGRPRWSPDGRQFLLIGFDIPAHVTLMDSTGKTKDPLEIPKMKLYSPPNWVNDRTIVAVVGTDFGDSIALIDVTNPAQAKVKEVLWKMNFKGAGPDIRPHHPAYVASAGRCVFIGGAYAGMALYTFQRGQSDSPKRMEPEGYDSLMQDVALSPDGRFALFTANRAGPRQRGSTPPAAAPRPNEGR